MQRIRGVEAVRRGKHALGPRISNAKCFEPELARDLAVSRRGGAEISGHRCGGHYSDGCVPHAERWLFFTLDHYPGYLVKRDATRWSIEQPPELARGKSFWEAMSTLGAVSTPRISSEDVLILTEQRMHPRRDGHTMLVRGAWR
jgi:hypothetical protein